MLQGFISIDELSIRVKTTVYLVRRLSHWNDSFLATVAKHSTPDYCPIIISSSSSTVIVGEKKSIKIGVIIVCSYMVVSVFLFFL